MAEDVSTGGLIKFRYEKGSSSKLSEDKKNEIREAYASADERKRRERRNRILFWGIGIIILVLGLALIWKLS